MPVLRLMIMLMTTLTLQSCATLQEVRFDVDLSALDYLQMVRTYVPTGSQNPYTQRFDLSGSGHLQLTAGRSNRVRSGFWQQQNEAEDWGDWEQDYVVLSQEKTQAYFQKFVDAGFFDHQLQQEENPDMKILVAIGRRQVARFTAGRAFHEIFEQMLREFE